MLHLTILAHSSRDLLDKNLKVLNNVSRKIYRCFKSRYCSFSATVFVCKLSVICFVRNGNFSTSLSQFLPLNRLKAV